MPTTDTRPTDRLEARLLDLFTIDPEPAVIDRLDARMRAVLRRWRPDSRRERMRPGRRAGFVGLLAAALVIGGASGGLQSLYGLLSGPFDLPWHRGTEVNLSQVVDGYRVTIDRAYADATRLALAISVVDERERPGTTQLAAYSTIVTDEAGEYTEGGGAASSPDGPFAAANVAWKTPALLPLPSGPRKLHVVVPFIMVRDDATPPPDDGAAGPNDEASAWNPWRQVAGPWTFDFEVDVDGGTLIEPGVSAEVDGLTVKASRLIVAPSIVRAELHIEGLGGGTDWSPIGSIRHGNRVMRFVMSTVGDDPIVVLTDRGTDDVRGAWTMTIDELVGGPADERLAGPWTLEFTVP